MKKKLPKGKQALLSGVRKKIATVSYVPGESSHQAAYRSVSTLDPVLRDGSYLKHYAECPCD